MVIGPIANDTIFETFGIISSGFLETGDAMKLLMIGPEYIQAAVKTKKALDQLRWIGAERAAGLDQSLKEAEQRAYQITFARVMQEIAGE